MKLDPADAGYGTKADRHVDLLTQIDMIECEGFDPDEFRAKPARERQVVRGERDTICPSYRRVDALPPKKRSRKRHA